MHPWRILVTDGLHDTGLNILERESEVVVKNDISADDLIKEIADFDAIDHTQPNKGITPNNGGSA